MWKKEYSYEDWGNRMSVEEYSYEYWTIGMWLEEYAVEDWLNRISGICAASLANLLLLAKLKVLYMFDNKSNMAVFLETK